jgi:Asp-tRNA(Asn)/Glu-tRNA(Gln) amidotransferase A subunit family amidase
LWTPAIERIERINPSLNAVITRMYEHAREAVLNRAAFRLRCRSW